jgi:hypothetical protein
MHLFRKVCLISISLLLLTAFSIKASAQQTFPAQAGDKVRYTAYIEMPKGYISGLCILVNDGQAVKGSLFNEFGISSLDFSYCIAKDKVKLHDVMPMMDKWYIRRVLRKDLRQLMHCLQQGMTQYKNEHRQISYTLTPITETNVNH